MRLVRGILDILQLPRTRLVLEISLLAFIILVTLSGVAGSGRAEIGYSCVDGNSYHNWTLDGELHNVTEPCRFSCIESKGICANEPAEGGFFVIAILAYVGIAGIAAYVSMNTDRNVHGAIQVFFLFLAIFMIWQAIGAIRSALDIMGILLLDGIVNTSITVWFYSAMFILAYVMIMFVYNLYVRIINYYGAKERRRRGGLDPTRGDEASL